MSSPEAEAVANVRVTPALEVSIAAPAPAISPTIVRAIVFGFAAFGSWRMPYLFGVSVALPWTFVVLAWWLAAPRARSLVVRFFSDALELDAGQRIERFEWDLIREVIVTPTGFALSLPFERRLELPKRSVDRKVLEGVLPPHVQWSNLAVGPPPGRIEVRGKALLFFLVLVLALAAVHQLIGGAR